MPSAAGGKTSAPPDPGLSSMLYPRDISLKRPKNGPKWHNRHCATAGVSNQGTKKPRSKAPSWATWCTVVHVVRSDCATSTSNPSESPNGAPRPPYQGALGPARASHTAKPTGAKKGSPGVSVLLPDKQENGAECTDLHCRLLEMTGTTECPAKLEDNCIQRRSAFHLQQSLATRGSSGASGRGGGGDGLFLAPASVSAGYSQEEGSSGECLTPGTGNSCTSAGSGGQGSVRRWGGGEGWGGRGRQKWPDQIFPVGNFVFSHGGHFGLEGEGGPEGGGGGSSFGVQPF